MGWFNDNEALADDAMEEAVEAMGFNRWYKDPQPAGGVPGQTRVEYTESEWDPAKWRRSNLKDHVGKKFAFPSHA